MVPTENKKTSSKMILRKMGIGIQQHILTTRSKVIRRELLVCIQRAFHMFCFDTCL